MPTRDAGMDTYDDRGKPLTDDLGRPPAIETDGFLAFGPRANRGARGTTAERLPKYRQCFELVGGKWEGFVSAA